MIRKLLPLILLTSTLVWPFMLYSQDNAAEDKLQQAIEAYDFGHFEAVDSLLAGPLDALTPENQVEAYRILTLSSLQRGDQEGAENYASQLLKLNPFYSPYNESPRFEDLIERLKTSRATFSTASQQSETLEEVPVPFTLITQEMIQASGARTLSELLQLYVPGMTGIDGMTDNIAMRGTYSIDQSSLLVLLDGVRLNNHTLNSEPLDYRNTLDKIQQVEVLRGPASSLYGNVALTAVVNIITKHGSDLNGHQLTARLGTFGTKGFSWVFGKGNLQSENLTWFSIFDSKGEAIEENGIKNYLGGYNSSPTYEIGSRIRWEDLTMQLSARHAKKVPYVSLIQLSPQISYDNYDEINGEKPGMSQTDIKADLSYNHSWGPLTFTASLNAEWERQQFYDVMADNCDSSFLVAFSSLFSIIDIDFSNEVDHLFTKCFWESYSLGSTVNLSYNYNLANGMSGALLAGLQYDMLIPTLGNYAYGRNYNDIAYYYPHLLDPGNEHTFSAFIQFKHYVSPHFIVNGGVRYDHLTHYNDTKCDPWSPRISLIWLPNKTINVKVGYSHSFVDAPYFYRSSQLLQYGIIGSYSLEPETSDAGQIGITANWEKLHLRHESNFFFNRAADLVRFSNFRFSNSGGSGFLQNDETTDIVGLEEVLEYTTKQTLINLNATWQYQTMKKSQGSIDKQKLSNVPMFITNLTMSQQLCNDKSWGKLWLRGNLHLQSCSKLNQFQMWDYFEQMQELNKIGTNMANDFCEKEGIQIEDLRKNYEVYEEEYLRYVSEKNEVMQNSYKTLTEVLLRQYHQPFYAIVNLGLDWQLTSNFRFSADVHNLFDRSYMLGSYSLPVPQQGRSVLFTLQYHF